MIRRSIVLLCGVILCLGLLSCRRISADAQRPPLKIEPVQAVDAIPAEYGNLVGVTQRDPNSALLWFEKPDKTIVILALTVRGENVFLSDKVVVVPRSSK